MDEKRKITEEEKRQLAKFFKTMLPNDTLDEDDILWIMNEVENGNKDVDFDEFMKAKKVRTLVAKKTDEPHFCFKCKYQTCKSHEEPCRSCNEWPHSGYLNMTSKWELKEDNQDIHLCKDCKFVENPVFKEPCNSCFSFDDSDNIYHKNWLPKPKEEEKEEDDVKYPVYDAQYFRQKLAHIKTDIKDLADQNKDISDRLTSLTTGLIEDDQKNCDRFAHIDRKMDDILEKLTEVDSKLDILDQRMHDFRKHQILKDMKCVTQVKDVKIDIPTEPLFKVGDKVKLKSGKTVYTVISITHFMCGNKKVYRYRITHPATTPHYENENRLVKA